MLYAVKRYLSEIQTKAVEGMDFQSLNARQLISQSQEGRNQRAAEGLPSVAQTKDKKSHSIWKPFSKIFKNHSLLKLTIGVVNLNAQLKWLLSRLCHQILNWHLKRSRGVGIVDETMGNTTLTNISGNNNNGKSCFLAISLADQILKHQG